MKVLVTGHGGSAGSWTIRGQQLGRAAGAVVRPMASLQDCMAADVIVAVKRVPDVVLTAIRESGKPWFYDIVDAFPQPGCSNWGHPESIGWLTGHIERLNPTAVIWPNARMQADFGGGGAVIYHHHRKAIMRNPIRKRIEVIGYEGDVRYISGWMSAIEKECQRLGARFVVNPAALAEVDVVLALRSPGWNGYPQRHWKSNVKLANAHGSGTPFIGIPEDGYLETMSGAERWADTPKQLRQALQQLEPQDIRREVSAAFLEKALPVECVAVDYRLALCALNS